MASEGRAEGDSDVSRRFDWLVLGTWILAAISGVLLNGLTLNALGYTVTGILVYYAVGIAFGGTIRELSPVPVRELGESRTNSPRDSGESTEYRGETADSRTKMSGESR